MRSQKKRRSATHSTTLIHPSLANHLERSSSVSVLAVPENSLNCARWGGLCQTEVLYIRSAQTIFVIYCLETMQEVLYIRYTQTTFAIYCLENMKEVLYIRYTQTTFAIYCLEIMKTVQNEK